MTLAFSYIRMSTPEQLKGDSLRRQLERSRRLADARGWTLDETLRDLGKSAFRGTHREAGAFGEFLDRVKSGRVPAGSVLIVESLDRLSREAVPVALSHFLALINAGVVLVTLDSDPPREFRADTLNEMDLMITIVGMSRAHGESKRKSDLLKPAWDQKRKAAREANKPLTGALPMWLKIAGDRFEVIPERAEVVREIFQATVDGIGRERLVKILNQRGIPAPRGKTGWATSSITYILGNEAVIGRYQPFENYYEAGKLKRRPVGEMIPNYFPAIIAVELFQRAKAATQSRIRVAGGQTGSQYSNLFRGLCFCGACGAKMEYFNKGNAVRHGGKYLQCSSVKRGTGCTARTTYGYDDLEAAFLANVHHFDFSRINAGANEELQRVWGRLAELTLEKSDLDRKYSNLLDLVEAEGMNPRIRGRVGELEVALEANGAELERLQTREAALTHAGQRDTLRQLDDLKATMERATGDDRYRIRAQLASLIRGFTSNMIFIDGVVAVGVGEWTRDPPLLAYYFFRGGRMIMRVGVEYGRSTDPAAHAISDIEGKSPEELLEIYNDVEAASTTLAALKSWIEPHMTPEAKEWAERKVAALLEPVGGEVPADASFVVQIPQT